MHFHILCIVQHYLDKHPRTKVVVGWILYPILFPGAILVVATAVILLTAPVVKG